MMFSNLLARLFLLCILFQASSSYASIAQAQDFLDSVIKFSELSHQLKGNADAKARDLLMKIKGNIDFVQFAKLSLGTQYSKATPQQKQKFQSLLEQLIELAAFPKARFISAKEETLKYSLTGARDVVVKGKIEREKSGDLIVNDFVMRLYFSPRGSIYDIKIEEELLSKNIERQIQRNMEKKTLEDLISLMEKRVEKLREKEKQTS